MVLLALLVVVAAEVAALVWVAGQIGAIEAVLLLVVVSALGPWMVRRAGFGTWRRARRRLEVGEMPGREATDGLVLLGAGVLICVPGFITDAVGLLLLFPPVRAGVRRLLVGRLTAWAAAGRAPVAFRVRGGPRPGPVVDAGTHLPGNDAPGSGGRPHPGDRPPEPLPPGAGPR